VKRLEVMIVDDEPPARQRLQELVARAPGYRIGGVHRDGGSALRKIRESPPDIVLLDIRMPGVTGTEVARLLEEGDPPEVVFVTAYGEHAPEAFDVGAADYLVKPFDDERFARALERCRERIRRRKADRDEESGPLRRLALEHRGRKVIVPLEDVTWMRAEGAYVEVHAAGRSYLLRERLGALDERLPAGSFCRIHRSVIVRLDRIAALEPRGRGDWTAYLDDGTELPVSRTRRQELEHRLGTP